MLTREEQKNKNEQLVRSLTKPSEKHKEIRNLELFISSLNYKQSGLKKTS